MGDNKYASIERYAPYALIVLILIVWQALVVFKVVPRFMLPSPSDVVFAFLKDFPIIMGHLKTTLMEAFFGLSVSVVLSFLVAILMDSSSLVKKSVYPILVLSQTIPTVAIAPILVLWLGYEMLPKIVLIVITCFFPITIGLLDGFAYADVDTIRLMQSFGASKGMIFRYVKFPGALGHFFAGLRISVSYSIVGAVISEWLGGLSGLGVYMIRVKKSYNFDKMFAVIFLISIISLLLMKTVDLIQKKTMPWVFLKGGTKI